MKRLRFFWWMVAGPIAVLAAVLAVAHPYLAITEKSGGDVLVVEGWMDPPQMAEAARIAIAGNYRAIYTTGSIRPFAYYLRVHDGIDVHLRAPVVGNVSLVASGNVGAGFSLIGGSDTLLREQVKPTGTRYSSRLSFPIDRLRLVEMNAGHPDPHADDFFVQLLTINDENAHLLQDTTIIFRADGGSEPGWPTYADRGRAQLIEDGIPADHTTAVPAWGWPDSRSWANASYFNVQAKADRIVAFDVATLGVHARRSRALFQRACGPNVKVGVISIPDPLCPRRGWWTNTVGWYRMLKEIAGSPEAYAVEFTR